MTLLANWEINWNKLKKIWNPNASFVELVKNISIKCHMDLNSMLKRNIISQIICTAICIIWYFNEVPFRYFLMHIINKPDTEYTGQVKSFWILMGFYSYFRKHTYGSFISSGVGTSFLLVTVFANNMKKNWRCKL